jgi:ADP-heptose:LPS heptosyltransferase
LRASFPKARLELLIEPPYDQGLLGSNAHDEILSYDSNHPLSLLLELRRRRYDWIVDFKTTSRSALLAAASGAPIRSGYARIGLPHRLAYNRLYEPPRSQYKGLDYLDWVGNLVAPASSLTGSAGALPADGPPGRLDSLRRSNVELHFDYRIPADSTNRANLFLAEAFGPKPRRIVSIAPASPTAYKRWPAKRYAAIIDHLISNMQAGVLLVWGRGEKPFVEEIAAFCSVRPVVAPELPSLLDLAALLKEVNLHLGPDNGARQVAQAVGTPTMTLYGPGDPVHWTHPDSVRHKSLKMFCACESGPATKKDRCRTLDCLMALSVADVRKGIESILVAPAVRVSETHPAD